MTNFIWDFDGTLFNTYPGMIAALMATLHDHGETGDAAALLLATKRDSMKLVLDDFGVQKGVDRAVLQTEYTNHELVLNANPQPYAGARQVLELVTAGGGVNLLWTHRDQKAWRLLAAHDLTDLFTGGTTIDMHFPRKPNPASVLYLLDKFELNAAETVVVGDRSLDIQAGDAAGCQTLYLDVDSLHDAPQPTYTAPTLAAAVPLVERLTK